MRSPPLIFLFFCLFLVGLVSAWEEAPPVPPGVPIPCNSRSFSIPFEVRSEGIADPPKEVELLYSTDRGARWFSVKRVPVEVKKFDFTAPSDGEYWFLFRTITLSGIIRSTNRSGPLLRVLVDTSPQNPPMLTPEPPPAALTGNPLRSYDERVPSARETTAVPITPPKPPRMQSRSDATKKKAVVVEKSVAPSSPQSPLMFLPSGEAAPFQPQTQTEEKKRPPIDPLFAEMSRFYDTPSEKNEPRVPNSEPRAPNPGAITGVALSDVQTQPRVVVRWNTGEESWQMAHVDVLRGTLPQGPWLPIATNLPNNGEYWWFVTKEDTKPFYVSVRLRAASGVSTSDVTRSPIRIDPTMFDSAAVTAQR